MSLLSCSGVNLYFSQHSGGWVLEVFAQEEWIHCGWFGTKGAAMKHLEDMHA